MVTSTAPTYQNFINGEWTSARGGETFVSTNPARFSEIVGYYQKSTPSEIEQAVRAAKAAQREWEALPTPKRGAILFAAAALLEQRKEALAQEMTREMGKILKETRGDVQVAIDVARYVAGEGLRAEGETVPSVLKDKFCLTLRQALGVVGIITPWNFPMAIPAWKVFPALLAGNTVLLKPASDTPLLALRMAEILTEAGLPAGVLNVVTGPGGSLGDTLVSHPDVNMISLTGSTEVGRHVAEICGRDLRRCSLELGGKNAVIVMEDADLALAVTGVSAGAFGTTGQRCTATSRVIIQRSVEAEFTDRLIAATQQLRVGDGLESSIDMGPLVNAGRVQTVHDYTKVGQQEGAKLLIGGSPLTSESYSDGAFYQPTIFSGVRPEMRIAREEIFGPFVSILTVNSFDEAIEVANGTEYGLSTSIFTENTRYTFRAMREIVSGLVYLNAPTANSETHLPFGGMKASGNGHRELGAVAVDNFSEIKTVYLSYPPRSH